MIGIAVLVSVIVALISTFLYGWLNGTLVCEQDLNLNVISMEEYWIQMGK